MNSPIDNRTKSPAKQTQIVCDEFTNLAKSSETVHSKWLYSQEEVRTLFLPSAIDDALDTLYEPSAVFSQFLESATINMTFFVFFFFSFPFLASVFLVLSFLAFLCFSFLSFPFSFCLVSISSFFFPFLSFILFSSCFFSPIDLRLSCVCVVIYTTCNICVVVFLGWQAVYYLVVGFSKRE